MKTSHPQSEKLTHPQYRADIDGLRAIAVLSVVGFHAFPKWIHGGFIGVDIFFVISGFLISTIIFSNLENASFSLVEFYRRRIKRIFPALLLILITTYILGWFVLLADEYKQIGKHIVGGTTFLSNFMLWNESGYFDNDSANKPLLHLWSLAIEEQFYIFWPLLIGFVWKKKWGVVAVSAIITLVSFTLNVYNLERDISSAFYLPSSRFWELMIGCLLAYLLLNKPLLYIKHNNLRSFFGLALLASGLLAITKEQDFPGWWALSPTIGAFLIISASPTAWVNRKILSNKLLVWFGLISYPLYLWHWPLLTFGRIIEGKTPSYFARFAIVLISIVLAWLTYKFIERPIRFGNYSKLKTVALLTSMFTVGYVGYLCYIQDGYSFRAFPKKYESYTQSITKTDRTVECFEIPYAYETKKNWFCNLGEKTIHPRFFAIGDSHALSVVPALEKYSKEHRTNILFAGTSGCPPLLGIQAIRGEADIQKNNCQKLNERVFEYVRDNKIEAVLLIARWSYYTGGTTHPTEFSFISMDSSKKASKEFSRASFEYGLNQTIRRYNAIGVHIYLFEDNPQQLYDPKTILRKSGLTDRLINKYAVTTAEHHTNQSWISNQFKRIANDVSGIINFDDALCNRDLCPLVKNGEFLYYDDDHLSIAGSMKIYHKIETSIESSRLH